eukprot:GILK01008093.1.p1 GENE.GILK01008093.1~~GILK01008093.1.p1  ORF type:complete len:552 (-),score=95.49 GILK01008093.1:125-1780(-)
MSTSMSEKDKDRGLIRVHVSDHGYKSLLIEKTTTAQEVCDMLRTKLKVDGNQKYALFLIAAGDARLRERCLTETDRPLDIQEKSGGADRFRFVYKAIKSRNDSMPVPQSDSSGEEEEQILSLEQKLGQGQRAGFLMKRGKLNRAWKERWFVLKGDKLYYRKTQDGHEKKTHAITFIPIGDCTVKESKEDENGKYSFDIITNHRIYSLRAKSQSDMEAWIAAVSKQTALKYENDYIAQAEKLMIEEEINIANRDDKIIDQIANFDGMMELGIARGMFLRFMEEEYSEENLLFYMAVEDYKMLCRQGNRQAAILKANELYERYIAAGSKKQVGLESADRTALDEKVQEQANNLNIPVDTRLFDGAREKVRQYMKNDVYPRFLQTQMYRKHMLSVPTLMSLQHFLGEKRVETSPSSSSSLFATFAPGSLSPSKIAQLDRTSSASFDSLYYRRTRRLTSVPDSMYSDSFHEDEDTSSSEHSQNSSDDDEVWIVRTRAATNASDLSGRPNRAESVATNISLAVNEDDRPMDPQSDSFDSDDEIIATVRVAADQRLS